MIVTKTLADLKEGMDTSMIKRIEFMGEKGLELENEFLRAVILPERGGKVASLFSKVTKMEILYQNKAKVYKKAEFGSDFGEFEACGFDDAFPNVDEEIVEIDGSEMKYPDHGEIWSAAFEENVEEEKVHLYYHSKYFEYEYNKTFWLERNRLHCSYKVVNSGFREVPYIWTMHCLVNVTPEMQLIFPEGTTQVENVFNCKHLGEAETTYSFPCDMINGKMYDFSKLPLDDMVKYYVVGKVEKDGCGYAYPETQTRVKLYYDTEKLPYLGCWITVGGYRGEKNCALEPCTDYYDSVKKAKRINGKCSVLKSGEKIEFTIDIEVEKDK